MQENVYYGLGFFHKYRIFLKQGKYTYLLKILQYYI